MTAYKAGHLGYKHAGLHYTDYRSVLHVDNTFGFTVWLDTLKEKTLRVSVLDLHMKPKFYISGNMFICYQLESDEKIDTTRKSVSYTDSSRLHL